jgi:hypothetical protein
MFRTALACAVVVGVCIVEFGSNSGAVTSFIPGNATAQAQAISVAPTTGGLNYAITLATSISAYQNTEAQSLSQTIDLGAIGTALEAAGCSGGPPILPSKDVPPSVQAESVNGNQSLSDTITPASSPLGVGTENAVATTQPSSNSATNVADLAVGGTLTSLGGLLTIGGLGSTSHASIDDGNTRTATATSTVGSISLLGGLVQLGGLSWTATQQTGAVTTATAAFSLGTLTVAGVKIDLSKLTNILDPQSVLTIINTALSPIGLNIQWPAETTLSDGTVEITPLTIGIDNNTLGQQVIGEHLGQVQTVRQALVNALLAANCNFATGVLVADIGIGVLSGGGNLNIQLGGAKAETNDLQEASPFGSGQSLPAASAALTGNSGAGATAGTAGTPAVPGFSGNTGAGLTTGTSSSATTPSSTGSQPRESLGPVQKTTDCVSLGPAGGGCNSGNVAVPIGLAALALVVGLFTWDYLRQRRRGRLAG